MDDLKNSSGKKGAKVYTQSGGPSWGTERTHKEVVKGGFVALGIGGKKEAGGYLKVRCARGILSRSRK